MHPAYTQLIAMIAAVVAGVAFADDIERPVRSWIARIRARS